MDIMGIIRQLLQQQPQRLISPVPKSESPGGYNSPLQPGLNAYYQREAQANSITPQQAMQNQSSKPMGVPQQSMGTQSSFIPQAQAAGQNPFSDFTTTKVPQQYAGVISQAAQQYGINPNILASLLFTEHGFQPTGTVKNFDGSSDRGIAQINDRAHPEVSDQQAQDPSFAIPWAAKTLSGHIKNLGLQRGIVAYNTGDEGSKSVIDPSKHPYYKKVTSGLSQRLRQQLGLQ